MLRSKRAQRRLIEAAKDQSPVSGFTHDFYKYPARFSAAFVRAAVEVLTEPGDLVLDPFVGGGTSLVEALALGRNAVGSDISSLAAFVSTVKSTLYSNRELERFVSWGAGTARAVNIRSLGADGSVDDVSNMTGASTWRLKRAISQSTAAATNLHSPRLERLARCAVLRVGQWALDGRKKLPTVDEYRTRLWQTVHEMAEGAATFAEAVRQSDRVPESRCFNTKSSLLADTGFFSDGTRPKLVITSPPYPGVHVLYHRWQVDGRKESDAPFWIANQLDGDGAAYYTLGARNTPELRTYFENLRLSLDGIVKVCASGTVVVQVVAFSDPIWQLPRYLSICDDVGLRELLLSELRGSGDGRLWRDVPNRRWYANQRGKTGGSREAVLFHRVR